MVETKTQTASTQEMEEVFNENQLADKIWTKRGRSKMYRVFTQEILETV